MKAVAAECDSVKLGDGPVWATSLTTSLRDSLRRRKPEKRRGPLEPRGRADLVAAEDLRLTGRPTIVPDTNVYIMAAEGTLPIAAASLAERALLFHCSVCLGELATGVANADPSRPTWQAIRDHYAALIDACRNPGSSCRTARRGWKPA